MGWAGSLLVMGQLPQSSALVQRGRGEGGGRRLEAVGGTLSHRDDATRPQRAVSSSSGAAREGGFASEHRPSADAAPPKLRSHWRRAERCAAESCVKLTRGLGRGA